jgi:HEAT repeat protein
VLKQAVSDKSAHVRGAAAEALANIGAKGALAD